MMYCMANIPDEFGLLIAFRLCCATFHITCKCIPLPPQKLISLCQQVLQFVEDGVVAKAFLPSNMTCGILPACAVLSGV